MSLGACLLMSWAQCLAEPASPEPAPLEPVVVTATREARPVTEVAGNISVVTRDDLALTQATSFDDIFRYIPGVDASTGGTRFGSDGPILRGLGGNRVVLEVDGIPVSHHFAIGKFSNATRDFLDVGHVQRVEIMQGPASTLYGSSALGGVVSIVTPSPRDVVVGPGPVDWGAAQGMRQADDSRHSRGLVAFAGKRLGALASATLRSGHEREAEAADVSDRQDTDSRSSLGKVSWETQTGGVLTGSYYGFRRDTRTDMRSVLGSGRFGQTTRLTGDDHYKNDVFAVSYRLGQLGWLDGGTLRAYDGETHITQDTVDERAAASRPVLIDRRFEFRQDTRGLAADLYRTGEVAGLSHRVGFGAEWTESWMDEMRHGRATGIEDGLASNEVLGENFPLRDFPRSVLRELGVYVQDEVTIGRVRVIAGARFDHYRLDAQEDAIYLEDNPATSAVDIGADTMSPKLGVVLQLTDRLDGWVQYAHGFRAPAFDEANVGLDIPLFNIRALPNPDLEPETSDGLEAGLRWRSGPAHVDFSVFHTRYDDFIESRSRLGLDPGSGKILFQSRNVHAARVYGVQTSGRTSVTAFPGLSLHAAASWVRGDNLDDDLPLNSVAPPQAVVGATWTGLADRVAVSLVGTFTARYSRLDETSGELFEAPGYGLLDVFISGRIGKQLIVRLAVENLTDKTWWHWADVTGLAPGDPLVPVLSRPGRSVGVDLSWSL